MTAVPLRDLLRRPVLEVAPALLGAHLTTVLPDGEVTVRLTEVEAYDGERDPGSHAYRGRTSRNEVMFGRAGHLYVYRHMGLHHCANVVTGVEGRASAVLLRAGEVVAGAELARERRRRTGVARHDVDLARGPARLAVALGIDMGALGTDVVEGSRVRLSAPESVAAGVESGPRVGVAGPGADALRFPWRFWIGADPTVSAFRPGAPSRRRARNRSGPDEHPGASGAGRTAD